MAIIMAEKGAVYYMKIRYVLGYILGAAVLAAILIMLINRGFGI